MSRSRSLWACVLALAAAWPAAGASGAELAGLCRTFSGFDQNKDGRAEIRSLRPAFGRGDGGRRALVLVESRILEPLAGALILSGRVERLVDDLAREGYRADAVSVTLEPGTAHQDGAYVLALREFLRAVAKEGELAGVILIGHFPDALLVRTCNWYRRGDVTIGRGGPKPKSFKQTLVGRAKVFYDEPREFAEALKEGQPIGAAWARYFDVESQADSWSKVGGNISRKRAYFWSVLGDWSLKLTKPAG